MIFFRVDSNDQIASGHVMRCMAIAEKIMKYGERVQFLTADENPIVMITTRGFDVKVLHSQWNQIISEIEKVKCILINEYKNSTNIPVFFIDTYQVSKEYVESLKPYAKIVYLGSKHEYLGPLDYLINYSTNIDYNWYTTKYSYECGTELLLGPQYAPLRSEFQGGESIIRDQVQRILITTGNTDKNCITERIIKKVLFVSETVIFDVVVGSMFHNKKKLKELYGSNNCVILHENVRSMSSLMKQCDLAISANGTTVYEMAAVGLPVVSFAMVPEQLESASKLGEMKVIDYCGKAYVDEQVVLDNIASAVKKYCASYGERKQLRTTAHNFIDGNGCQRLVNKLLNIGVG